MRTTGPKPGPFATLCICVFLAASVGHFSEHNRLVAVEWCLSCGLRAGF
jgi:hypothetical protein